MLLDVPTGELSVEEQMVVQSGMYGGGAVGGYGGLPADEFLDTTFDIDALTPESAQQSTNTTTTTPPAAKTSSASSAQLSLIAGVVAAAAVLML